MTFLVVIVAVFLCAGGLYWLRERRSNPAQKANVPGATTATASAESVPETIAAATTENALVEDPKPDEHRQSPEVLVELSDEHEIEAFDQPILSEVLSPDDGEASEPQEVPASSVLAVDPSELEAELEPEPDPVAARDETQDATLVGPEAAAPNSAEDRILLQEEAFNESDAPAVEIVEVEFVEAELERDSLKTEESFVEEEAKASLSGSLPQGPQVAQDNDKASEELPDPLLITLADCEEDYSAELAAELPPSAPEEEIEPCLEEATSPDRGSELQAHRQEVSAEDAAKLIADAVETALEQIEPIPESPADGWIEEVTALADNSAITKLLHQQGHVELLGGSFKQIGDLEAEEIGQRLAEQRAKIKPRAISLPDVNDFAGPVNRARELRLNASLCASEQERVRRTLQSDEKVFQIRREAQALRQKRDESAASFSTDVADASLELRVMSSSRQIQRSEGKVVSLRAFDKALEIYEKWERRDREARTMRDWRQNQAVPIKDSEVLEGEGFTIFGGTPVQKVDTEVLKAQLAEALAAARAGEITEKQEEGSPEACELDELAQAHSLIHVPDYEIPRDYIPAAESIHELFQLKTVSFEGPLDLLLFLIRRHQIDILDIPISFICAEYLACLKTLQELNIDVAAEFLLMVADLLHIKSKSLLPKAEEVEDEEEVDPRWALVQRLLEYQKYRDVAQHLGARHRLGRDVFERIPEHIEIDVKESKFKEVGAFELIKAFDAILKRKKGDKQHHVIMETVSLRDKILEMIHDLATKRSLPFHDLIANNRNRIQLIVTFLACLEMAKLRLMKVFQSESGALYLEPRFTDPNQATRKLDGLDEDQYA